MAAAVSAKKAGLDNIIIFERDNVLGGILNQCIHNGFGLHTFKEELTGPEYAERYSDMVKEPQEAWRVSVPRLLFLPWAAERGRGGLWEYRATDLREYILPERHRDSLI